MSRAVVALGVLGLLLLTTPVVAKDIPQDIMTLLAQEQYSAAVAPLTEFLEKDKKNYEGWTFLGDAYYNLGHDTTCTFLVATNDISGTDPLLGPLPETRWVSA